MSTKKSTSDNNDLFRVNVFYKPSVEDFLPQSKVGCIFVQAKSLDLAKEIADRMVSGLLATYKVKPEFHLTASHSSESEKNFFIANKQAVVYDGVLN